MGSTAERRGNRDAGGNYKFAHRSIMEYLFVRRLLSQDHHCYGVRLTDQMKVFLAEMLSQYVPGLSQCTNIMKGLDFVATGDFMTGSRSRRLRRQAVDAMASDEPVVPTTHAQSIAMADIQLALERMTLLEWLEPLLDPAAKDPLHLLSDQTWDMMEQLKSATFSSSRPPTVLSADQRLRIGGCLDTPYREVFERFGVAAFWLLEKLDGSRGVSLWSSLNTNAQFTLTFASLGPIGCVRPARVGSPARALRGHRGGEERKGTGTMASITVKLGDQVTGIRTLAHVPFVVGRDEGCNLRIDNLGVSGKHCRFVWADGKLKVEDMGSTNGTKVNGERVESAGRGKVLLSQVEGAALPSAVLVLVPALELHGIDREGPVPAFSLALPGRSLDTS